MPLSKRLRFEIFKRDSFACQYCGRRPPDVVLEIDHIDPKAEGGSDDEINLITSCFDCNRGKGARVLHERSPRPDADLAFLECQQEIAEAKRFLGARDELRALREQLVIAIQDHWYHTLHTGKNVPATKIIVEWLVKYSPQEITDAIDRVVPALRKKPWFFEQCFDNYLKYVSGILRHRRADAIADIEGVQ